MQNSPTTLGARTLHLFGPFELRTAAGMATAVPGGRARLLLQRLAARAPDAIDPVALEATLWPDDPPPTAARTLASLVSRQRAFLGAGAIPGSARTGYALAITDSLATDLAQVETLASEAHTRVRDSPALAASAALRGLDALARGPLFGGQQIDTDWFDELERRVATLRRRLQRALWEGETQLGQWDQIVDRAGAVLALDAYDEEATRALMTAYWYMGDRGSALHAHETLRIHLRKRLQAEPSPETDALYHAIATTGLPSHSPTKSTLPITVGPALVGRGQELGVLVDLWGDVGKRVPKSVVITGPLGSGRSRLVNEFADLVHWAGGAVYVCECYEAQHSAFLQPLLHVLGRAVLSMPSQEIVTLVGRWLDTLADLIPEVATVCDVEPYERASPDLEHRRAMQMIVHVISELARSHPLLLVFDDLHYAGTSTLEALQWIVRELPSVPVMVVATTAPDYHDRSLAAFKIDSASITLGPISRADVGQIAADHGQEADSDFIWDLTQGHVLFVVEVIASLKRGIDPTNIAGSLSKVVLDRVQRAGPETERILRAAAFVSPTFDVVTLERLLPDSPNVEPVLLGAATEGLLDTSGPNFIFANRVIRDVLYETALGPIRNRYHRALAEMVDDPGSKAAHFEAAGEHHDAALAWIEAAEAARRSFANHDVVVMFSRAATAAAAANDDEMQARALLGRGAAHEEIGNYELAQADHLEAERLARALGSSELLTRAIERLGWTAYYARHVEIARERAIQAVAMPGAHPSAWVLAGRIHHWGGEFDQATAAYQTALDHSDEDTDFVRASALSCLGALLEHGDRYSEASRTLDEAVELSQAIGAFRPLLRALFFQGIARANAGELAGALTALEMKTTLLDRYEVTFYRARTKTCLAWVWRELGDHKRSRTLSEEALEESRKVALGELQVEQELHALCSLGECDLLDGRSDEAAERFSVARGLLTGWLPFHWRAELRVVELETRLGLAEAEELKVKALAAKSPKYQALAASHMGEAEAATRLATQTGSLLLLAEVLPPSAARAARTRLAAQLPRAFRHDFVSDGRLSLRIESGS